MSNVRQSVGVPISDDFADNTGTPLVVNGANGDGYIKKADGTIAKIGAGQATTNANLTGPVTSVGNATAIANGAISNAMLANAAVANLSGTNTGDQAVATQADMEAASSTTAIVTPGRAQYHPGMAKAWVIFNGTGTVAILASYNVSSVTDNGVGDYTINFTTAFSSTNYVATFGGRPNAGELYVGQENQDNVVRTASALRIYTLHGSTNTVRDYPVNSVAFFGDQ